MADGPKLLLIDGMNLAFREFYSPKNLSYKGNATTVVFGMFKALISWRKEWPEHLVVFAWEGGYARRLRESEAGVAAGIVPTCYKESRRKAVEERKAEGPDEIESLFEQLDQVREGLKLTRTVQARVEGYEADDVIFTYANWAIEKGGEAIIISSDQDFYQCLALGDGVKVIDPNGDSTWTAERFGKEFGYGPELWVDRGALVGEVGPSKDDIHGVEGWGPVTADKYILAHGSVDAILAAVEEKVKRGKREEMLLMSVLRLRLAKSLKGMDIIPSAALPRPRVATVKDEGDVKEWLSRFGLITLMRDAWRIV